MLLPGLVAVVVLVLVLLSLLRRQRRQPRAGDLGAISDAWIRQHRASLIDPNR